MLKALFVQIVIPIAGTFEKIIIVPFNICFILFRDIFFRKDGFGRANRDTSAAINAGIGINPEIGPPFGIIFRAGDNAVYRADLYTVSFACA
jgi:hypothetical protein